MTKKPAQPNPKHAAAPESAHHGKLSLERLVFFSDGVFAIAVTLLALEIRLPATEGTLTNMQLLHNLEVIWPKYLSYVVSFMVIGFFWMGHHRKFRLIERYDHSLLMLNLLLLMVIAFVPFPTSVLSAHWNQTATIFYALTMTLAGVLSAAIWWYASRHNRLVNPHLDPQQSRREMLRALVVPGVFMFSVGPALINADLAKFSWLLIALLEWFI
jgi:uncharacterized membrane protein